MTLNAKDAIVEIMSDGVGRTVPQIVEELLRMDRIWFRNVCRSAVSSKCCDLMRDGALIRAGLEYRGDHAQPLIIWRIAPSTSNRSATALNRKPEVYSCQEERRSRRDR